MLYSSWSLLLCGGGGGATPAGMYLTSLCPLGGGRSVPAKTSTPLAKTSEHDTPLLYQARQGLLCQSKGQTAESKYETYAWSNQQTHCCDQSTGHMLCQSKRHTAVSNHERHYCIKARRRCYDAHDCRQTLLLCHSTTHQIVRALPSIEHRIHPRTHPQISISRKKCFGALGGEERRAAAVSKHGTGTATKQTTGALQFMVAFALRGTPPGIYSTFGPGEGWRDG